MYKRLLAYLIQNIRLLFVKFSNSIRNEHIILQEFNVVSCSCTFLFSQRGALSEGARHNFNRKGMVVVPGQNIATQRALELAIEAGAEDIKETVDEEGQPLLQVRHEVQRH